MTTGPTSVDDFVDGLKFNSFHLGVLIVCTLLTAVDGYEMFIVGWVLPDLAHDFGVARGAIASALVAQQVGMLAGAFIVPPLADRIGRPRTLLMCFAGMLVTALTVLNTKAMLPFTICRFITGVCATAIIPIAVTIASEVAPARLRATMSSITVSGTMIGSLMGAAVQGFVMENYGWRGGFWGAVILPAILIPLVYFFLPESLRARAARDPRDPAIQTLARRMQPAGKAPVTVIVPATEGATAEALLSDVFGPGNRAKTFLMWAISIGMFMFVAAEMWKTSIFKDVVHLPYHQIALTQTANTVGGFIGMLGIGFVIDRLGFKGVMVWSLLLAALSTVMIGVLAPGMGMLVAMAASGLFQHGGQAGVAALGAVLYPPESRATGLGWAYGAGRVSAIAVPLLSSFVLDRGFGPVAIFAMMGAPLAASGLFTWWLMSLKNAPRPVHAHG